MEPISLSDAKFKKSKRSKSNAPHLKQSKQAKKKACYVLITCDEPTEDGKMHVEMTYEGDTTLAAYLLENAQSILDERLSV